MSSQVTLGIGGLNKHNLPTEKLTMDIKARLCLTAAGLLLCVDCRTFSVLAIFTSKGLQV